jgi:tRNA dimethylallyltransferase
MKTPKLLVIVGPTAAGKTGLAIRLAQEFRTEIVSADSRQIFRELEIGTAKPTAEELANVPHHFINVRSIHDGYDAGKFGREALPVLHGLFETHDYVILCGGSGLYVDSVCRGFDEMPGVPDGVRDKIMTEYKEKGLTWLQQQVEMNDPDYFSTVDRQNPQRLVRALELNYATGRPVGEFRKMKKPDHPFTIQKMGLELDREELYARIDKRMDRMIGSGLFEEATRLYPFKNLNALQTVGYQEIFGYLDGLYDREEAIRLLKRNSRNYAKRQLTWFKKDREITWFRPDQWEKILSFTGR